jgi:hypothetical protein
MHPADPARNPRFSAERRAAASLMILVAGPVRGGTGDDPALVEANVAAMNETALALYRRGHLPVVGEWLSFPLLATAGSTRIGDDVYDEIQHPLAQRLLAHCDGCLRIGGPSTGADLMVETARTLGKQVWFSAADVP